jgi:hypothetical protein
MHEDHPDVMTEITPEQAIEHLEAVLASPYFATSRRSQEFLRYIVMETVQGRGDQIKERNIAQEVFGRGVDFEPGEDSLVRVKAREIRKRLAEYYENTPANGTRIELPLGGYSPQIHSTSEPHSEEIPPQKAERPVGKRISRRQLAWLLGGSAFTLGAASLAPMLYKRSHAIDLLWKPVFATRTPMLIFIPVLTDRVTGALDDRVGIGPAAALRRAADFLTAHKYPYHLRFGADLTYSQLREQPSLLLGGFSSDWSLRMTRDLRFTLKHSGPDQTIVDSNSGRIWRAVNPTPNGYADQDYGILCRLFDSASEQIVMLAAGITTFGTEAAASMFFDAVAFEQVVRQAPSDWNKKNMQAVVQVSVIGTTPSSPQVVATHFW